MSIADPAAAITNLTAKTQLIKADIDAPQSTTATFSIAYFPAWHIYLDDKEVPYKILANGLQVEIPAGRHHITAKFIQTPIEIIGNILSLTGVLTLVLGIIIITRKEKKHAKKRYLNSLFFSHFGTKQKILKKS